MYQTSTSKPSDDSICLLFGLPWWLSGKDSACNARETGDSGSVPVSGRSSAGGNGNPRQYSCLQNPKNRGAWRATVPVVAELVTGNTLAVTYYMSPDTSQRMNQQANLQMSPCARFRVFLPQTTTLWRREKPFLLCPV